MLKRVQNLKVLSFRRVIVVVVASRMAYMVSVLVH